MIDLSTNYMGIHLESPLVASSSPLCADLDNIKRLEDAGAGAVILPSLFEEQVIAEQRQLNTYLQQGTEQFAESLSYLPDFNNYKFSTHEYLEHVRACKKAVDLPVIGSLNGISRSGWIHYARDIQQAGADALELNIFFLPEDPRVSSQEVEENYIGLVRDVVDSVSIPVAVKLNSFFSSIPYMIKSLEHTGAEAVVLFNRFYQPDIDLTSLKLVPELKLSTSDELGLRLRWTGLVFKKVKIDIGITGGIHTAIDAMKCLAAGANVAMMTSALMINGINYIKNLNTQIASWLEMNNYDSVKSFTGIMSITSTGQPEAYTRANYLQIIGLK
ncbi:MAG TPA: dihydroorotate dehydrogenase-like protein [Chitinispirillaceae bacterium]|nr:dihydroorotate dehydrogenase-like protein [Chitinispirillaceae bacterium]